MAKATRKMVSIQPDEEQIRRRQIDKLLCVLADHQGSVKEAVILLNQLHRHGLLEMANAVLEQGENLLEVMLRQARQPGATDGIKSAIAFGQILTRLDEQMITRLGEGVYYGLNKMETEQGLRVNGVWDLLRALRDPEVARGLSALLALLQGLGQSLSEGKKV
ncbi:DUF1641 domain-containing protein [Paludifilum halophilum]|uniref:DUF1641 domain-containing protein n=1 Tax=Paludifilum halophilum TaxID=1642702 RepID=A0A235BB60_9BACL|nr:DUF1641 domain-containing protein [Paludifilum halophilum]OYD09117.1 hypothetical protein CHM34_04955 [Paludifilum halophilum]